MTLTLIGVNHKTAPVEVREKLSIPKGSENEVLDTLRESSRLRGASLISTCNRVEVLTSSDDENVIEPVVEMLAERAEIDQDTMEKQLYILRHRDVIRHMFRLASGLESMKRSRIEPAVPHLSRFAGEVARSTGEGAELYFAACRGGIFSDRIIVSASTTTVNPSDQDTGIL